MHSCLPNSNLILVTCSSQKKKKKEILVGLFLLTHILFSSKTTKVSVFFLVTESGLGKKLKEM